MNFKLVFIVVFTVVQVVTTIRAFPIHGDEIDVENGGHDSGRNSLEAGLAGPLLSTKPVYNQDGRRSSFRQKRNLLTEHIKRTVRHFSSHHRPRPRPRPQAADHPPSPPAAHPPSPLYLPDPQTQTRRQNPYPPPPPRKKTGLEIPLPDMMLQNILDLLCRLRPRNNNLISSTAQFYCTDDQQEDEAKLTSTI